MLDAIFNFVYPQICSVCKEKTDLDSFFEGYICSNCYAQLLPAPTTKEIQSKITNFYPHNNLYISNFYSLFSISENEDKFMNIIYDLKYHSKPIIGKLFGNEIGKMLQILNLHNYYSALIPIPIHHAKKRERGFNQSKQIALGIEEILGVQISDNLVKRDRYNISQTRLGAKERKTNIEKSFIQIQNASASGNDLIVDDVLTTGSTANKVAEILLNIGATSVDFASIAVA